MRCFMKWLFISIVLITPVIASATVRLPKIFTSNMVLQREKTLTIWGWADKGEKVSVSFNGQTASAKADKSGQWQVQLKPMNAGGPFTMNIKGKNNIELSNILLGDVYVCSGQSNMEWSIRASADPDKEIKEGTHANIRLFTVPKATSFTPSADVTGGQWLECNPSTVGDFSAVGYFFGRKLNSDLNIPIGLISTNWGGTNVQTWISWDVMGKKEAYVNTDLAVLESQKASAEERMKQFREELLHEKGEKERWFDPATSLDWKNIELPKMWENTEIGNVDGIIWFRKDIDIPANAIGQPFTLSLGPIDDIDITWVNGKQVGTTNAYNKDRVYTVDASLLKAGKNTIIVKVTDGGGGGGLYGKPEQLFLASAAVKIPLAGGWQYKSSILNKDFGVQETGPNGFPSQLYNAMIAPIIRYAIKGAIWYQGESNAGESYKYRSLFPEMINDWRTKWKDDFPFFWVQLANFMQPAVNPVESGWAELREAQSMTLSLPKTGQAVIIDIGEANDIHPKNKQDVGLRLALAAEKVVYGKDIVYSGPVYRSMKTEGNKIILEFAEAGSGLIAKDKYGYLKGFAIAGADRKFQWAHAWVEGNKVIVQNNSIGTPVAVRYAWGDNPDDANLYNKEGLPASPFRTDDWPGVTVNKNDYK